MISVVAILNFWDWLAENYGIGIGGGILALVSGFSNKLVIFATFWEDYVFVMQVIGTTLGTLIACLVLFAKIRQLIKK